MVSSAAGRDEGGAGSEAGAEAEMNSKRAVEAGCSGVRAGSGVVAAGGDARGSLWPKKRRCGRVRWRVCGDVWAVATEWRVRGGDPQMFHFICFYSSLYSRVFPRS